MKHFSLEAKAAIVTGGSSGIGRAIALRFREAGARVLVADRHAPPDGFAFARTDVSREEEVAAALQAAKEAFGQVDILVNNAGIQPLGVGFDALTGDLLARTFGVNVNGVAFGIKHAGRALVDGGRVINMASFVGTIGTPGAAAYAASKAAVIHLTRLGAIELGPRRITVNAISPGTILTPAVTDIPDNPEIPFIQRARRWAAWGSRRMWQRSRISWPPARRRTLPARISGLMEGSRPGWTEYALVPPQNFVDGQWKDDPPN